MKFHGNSTPITTGAPAAEAEKTVIAVHGRGATSQSILSLSSYFDTEKTSWIAPQAANNTWYPYSFLEDHQKNEPWLSSALSVLENLTNKLRADGLKDNQIFFLGFSQGACLASEFVARNGRSYGGLIAFSGGLIGPEPDISLYKTGLKDMPAFFGCSDNDFHIPERRVWQSAEILKSLGAQANAVIYPGMGHTIIEEEITKAKEILDS
jgi:phospholipase/carboxylesterase